MLLPPHEPWVERWLVGGAERAVLRSSHFDQLNNSVAIWEAAKLLAIRINGAFATHARSEPVAVEAVVERRSDGSIGLHAIVAAGSIRARSRVSFSSSSPSGPTAVQQWLELADINELVEDLLRHQSAQPNWYDLYKAFEVVRKLCGGQRALEQRPWCPLELSEFTHAANFFRHSRAHSSHEKRPTMTVDRAEQIVRALAAAVLVELSSPPGA